MKSEQNKTRKILVLAYKFPPYEAVGARRWAKFPKYFVEEGYTVHVITNNWKIKTKRSWLQDVQNNERIIIKKLQTPFNFFRSRFKFGNRIVNKIEHLLSKALLWTDESYFFYAFNFRMIKNYIQKNQIEIVIATGGPFSANYFASKLKKDLTGIKIIQDFRDLWTEEYFFEYPNRTKDSKIYQKELQMEKFSLVNCDAVVSVTPGCVTRLKNKTHEYGIKDGIYELVENGYDEADKRNFKETDFPAEKFDKNTLNISHFGTAAFSREDQFFNFLQSTKEKLLNTEKKIQFHFFGYFSKDRKQTILNSELSSLVRFYDFMPPSEIQRYMYFTDIHLVINDVVYHYAYGSKIYDAFLYKKPILLICKEESLYEMTIGNRIGLATNNTNGQNLDLIAELIDNFEKIKTGQYFSNSFNYERFELSVLTKKYINIIESLK